MNYIYLDQNIIDKIDTHIGNLLERFLSARKFIPVFSVASLTEIERGERPKRVLANIKSLLSIGARFIDNPKMKTNILELSSDEIFKLLKSKNQFVAESIKIISAAQFYQFNCTSGNELREKLTEVICSIKALIDRYGHTDSKRSRDLVELTDTLQTLVSGDVPEKFNYAEHVRSELALSPEEINNLQPAEMCKKIKELTTANGKSLPFDLSVGDIQARLRKTLLTLNIIGYWCDKIDSEKRMLAFHYDIMHGIYGNSCQGIVSADTRFLKRLCAAYHYLSIPTKVFTFTRNAFNELN